MTRMKNILERNVLEFINNMESSPHEAIAFLTIADSLYGNTDADVGLISPFEYGRKYYRVIYMFQFEMRLNVHKQLEFLQTVAAEYWIGLLKEYMIDVTYCLTVNMQH